MSVNNFYNLCNQHVNRAVEITCLDGQVHRGIIDRVDQTHVYMRPLDGAAGAGPGLYYWGYGAWGWPIALASIAAIAAIGFW